MRRLLAAALLCLALPAAAQYPSPGAGAPEAAAKPPAPAARIADVAWLQGYWVGEGLGGSVEDVWLPPKAGVLLGAFRLSRIAPGEFAFGRIVFQRAGPDGLVVKLGIREKGGEIRHETLTYRRKPL